MKDVRGLEIVKYCFKIAIEAILFEPLRWWVMQQHIHCFFFQYYPFTGKKKIS